MVFCQISCVEKIEEAFTANNMKGEIVTFDDNNNDLVTFIQQYKGTETNFRPNDFDQEKTMAWLMLTSGTTGLPKVAMIPFSTLVNSMCCWWQRFVDQFEITLTMSTLQWLSAYILFVSGPLRCYTRLQSSAPLTPQALVRIINKYKTKCPAYLYLVYGMTELVVPVFEFDDNTPENSTGYPMDKYQYRLVDEAGNAIAETKTPGELWIKGDTFFRGYLNNPEETKVMLTDDGWIKTGDMFYRDDQGFYFFVERKRLIIRHYGFMIAPLQIEEVIKRHPGVVEACVVGIPDPECMELPIAAILRKNGDKVDSEEIFALLKNSKYKELSGGLFFVDSFPVTPSGKINRSLVRKLALTTPTIKPKN